jgi:hypothetical protein
MPCHQSHKHLFKNFPEQKFIYSDIDLFGKLQSGGLGKRVVRGRGKRFVRRPQAGSIKRKTILSSNNCGLDTEFFRNSIDAFVEFRQSEDAFWLLSAISNHSFN